MRQKERSDSEIQPETGPSDFILYTEVGQNLGEWYGELNLPEGEVRIGRCGLPALSNES